MIKDICALTTKEKNIILKNFNDTAVDYPRDKCVHQLFEEQVNTVPDRIAVIYKNESLTYLQLNELVNEYCSRLQSLGVKKNDVVAIHLNRSYELIVFQIAILKAGAVFLPVDKRYPTERIKYMCNDCKVSVLITDESYKIVGTKTLYLNEFKSINSQQTSEPVFNDDVCYIIYTSGSTGNPKGCMLKCTSLINFCKNNNTLKTLKKKENNVFACVNSVSFDYFIAESLLPLLNGYTTVILDDEESTDQKLFFKAVENNSINVLMTTPTRLKLFFDNSSDCEVLKQLDCICTSGEALPPELLSMIYSKSPNAQVYNPLGPSECTVWIVGGELEKNNGIDIHIGKPIANTQIYIVDRYMQPTPIGVTGELCIAGDGMGAGYLNRPELTAEKFIDNPFGKGKLYKTGDLAYWREDGNIAYVGRNDFQVKIRGLRIELGEIENAISSINGISQAVVGVRKNTEGRQLICAFYTGNEIDAKEIRTQIGKKLPKYMLPHIFTHLDEMPLTSSGKVNRKALPEVDLENISNDTEYVAPETNQQKLLCKIVEKVLGVNLVGLVDDFFDLGGDSLKAIEFVSKAHNEGIYFNLQNVFDYPTIKLLCEFLANNDVVHNQYNLNDFKEIYSLLKNNFKCDFVPEKNVVGDILLTGATGFLGIHILAEFIENESGKIYCIVRGKSNEDSISRLEKQLKYYFEDKYLDLLNKRIIVLCGDIQEANFGINNIPKVDMVINAAASVKHYGSYKYFYDINVGGTINALKVAKMFDAKFIQISTLSVSGNSMADIFDAYQSESVKTFSERNLYIEQPLDNVYIRSKFEAEVAVYNEMLNGLKANIIRVGNLTNRSSDLKFQPNYQSNAFLSRVKAVIDMGMIPDYLLDLYSEFSPVDDMANAILKIAQHFNDQNIVFHVNNHNNLYFDRFIELANKIGIPMQVLDGDKFAKNLSKFGNNPKTQYIYEALINDMDKDGKLVYDSNIHIENDLTVEYLKKIGFNWSKIDYDYLKAYVEYFNRLGYLEV